MKSTSTLASKILDQENYTRPDAHPGSLEDDQEDKQQNEVLGEAYVVLKTIHMRVEKLIANRKTF